MGFWMIRNNCNALSAAAGLIAWLVCLGQAAAGPLTLTGQVTNAGSSFTIAQLQTLGSTSETVGTDTYVGVSLWSLLGGTAGGASNVITSGGGNNPILRNYIIATGASGTRSLISLGEIDQLFGGRGQPYLVAYEHNGATLAVPTLIVPQDTTGTRDIADLTNLSVLGVARPPVGPGGTTGQFTLSGVDTPGIYDLAALQALPATTDHNVTFFNGANPNGPHDYTGVSLWTLLTDAGIGNILTSYVLATGSDGFEVLYSLAELDPDFGAPSTLVGYAVDGGSLGSSGFARIVVPGDLRGGRYVSNIASLQVEEVAEPPTLALFAVVVLWIFLPNKKRPIANYVPFLHGAS
jgi:hypothetical protein